MLPKLPGTAAPAPQAAWPRNRTALALIQRRAARAGRPHPQQPPDRVGDGAARAARGKVSVGRGAAALEFLHAPAGANLGRVEIALGIDRYVVHPLEFAGHAAGAAKLRQPLTALPIERVDLHVGTIGEEDIALGGILR